MELINVVISAISTLVGLAGGGVGIYFWRESRELKRAEVRQKEIENELHQADWATERLKETESKVRELLTRIEELYKRIGELKDENRVLESEKDNFKFLSQKMQWFRCDVNKCSKRQPPRNYAEVQTDFDEATKQ